MGNACSKSPDASAGQRGLEISPAPPPDARDLGDVGVGGLDDMIADAADNVGDLLTGLHNTAAGLASGLVDGLVDDEDSLAGIDETLGINAGLTSSGALAQDIRERLAIFGIDVPGAAPTWLPPHGVGSAMKSMGYRVRNPVACINSMVGSVLVCEESESRPEWVDRNIVLDMLILARTVISKLLTFNTADDWIAQLEDRFDEDDDGDVDISELQAFIAEDDPSSLTTSFVSPTNGTSRPTT